MDIKDCIKLCTKIDKSQGVSNVKWLSVPKEKNQTPQYRKKPLPSHLEWQKSLHDHQNQNCIKSKKMENKNEEEDEEFQVAEIRQGIREAGLGWDATKAFEKRYKESQKKYAKATTDESNSESSSSFTTARTTTTSVTEDSFSSAVQDFQHLQISDEKIKKRNFPVEHASVSITDVSTSLNDMQCEKENLNRNINKQSIKFFESKKNTTKFCQPLKESIPKDPKQKHLVQKKVNEVIEDRKRFMNLSDERFCEFVSTKSVKSSKKSKPGRRGF